MKTIEIPLNERTNQRDGTTLILQTEDGTPLCPHCGKKMVKVQGHWENAMCPCWWKGQQAGDYYAQVVVAANPQDEFDYRTRRADDAAKDAQWREEKLMVASIAYAAATTKEAKFDIIKNLHLDYKFGFCLWGKRNKSKRDLLRKIIAAGGDFEKANTLQFP